MKHVLIVGAGALGSNLAFELTQRGATVTVLDAGQVGSGTSAATFGWINAYDKTPAAYAELNMLGIRAHERGQRTHFNTGATWFHQLGNLQIAADQQHMAALESKVVELTGLGYTAQLLTTAQASDRQPHLNLSTAYGAAYFADEGWVDTETMCSTLLTWACAAGATFAPFERVTGIGPGWITSTTPDHEEHRRSADVIVLAAGNGNRQTLADAGIDFPTVNPDTPDNDSGRPAIGLVCTTRPIADPPRHLVMTDGISMRPARNGGVTLTDSPTGAQWDIHGPEIWTIPNTLLDRAQDLYPPLQDSAIAAVQLGTRVLPQDGQTIADWVTPDQNIYAVATHSGVTLAAHLADTIATEILTGTRDQSLRTFGLDRFH